MLSRELIKSTRNLIIQHLVFSSSPSYSASSSTTSKQQQQILNDQNDCSSSSSTPSSSPKHSNLHQSSPSSSNSSGSDIASSNYKKSILTPLTGNEMILNGKEPTYEWKIYGNEVNRIEINLNPNESITAETGALLEMSSHIEMDTHPRGGFMASVKRMFTGQGIFLTKFKNESNTEIGRISLCSPYISKILAIKMSELGGELVCKKSSFLCGDNSLEITPRLTKRFSIGFFGGQGFIMQNLTGNGMAFIHASGSIIYRILKPQETIRVSTGCIVAFEPSVSFEIDMVKGAKNIFFSGEGLFLATLTGPGLCILQSLPFERLVNAISNALPSYSSSSGGSSSSSSSSDSQPPPQSSSSKS